MEIKNRSNLCIAKIAGLLIVLSNISCEYSTIKPDSAPIIYISKMVDTAYLNSVYNSETVEVEPCEGVTVTGKVNCSKLGTYYLDYDYADKYGNQSATVTRTVHVIQNPTEFLNGNYDAVCSCTVIQNNSQKTSVLTEHYKATISSSPLKNHFELVNLKINSGFAIPISSLQGTAIKIDFYRNTNAITSGTLSLSKTSFTIDTEVSGDDPNTKYLCKNSFKKNDLRQDLSVLK